VHGDDDLSAVPVGQDRVQLPEFVRAVHEGADVGEELSWDGVASGRDGGDGGGLVEVDVSRDVTRLHDVTG
jgi:hypothetical protein